MIAITIGNVNKTIKAFFLVFLSTCFKDLCIVMTIRDIKPTVNITAKTTPAISYSLLTRNSDSI